MRRPRPTLAAALCAAWTVFVLWGTLSPIDQLPPLPQWELLSFDTAAHAGIFLGTAALYLPTARWQRLFPSLRRRAFAWTLLACLGLGGLIELLQTGMQLGRQGEWTDMISNSLGALLGLLLLRLTRRWWDVPDEPGPGH